METHYIYISYQAIHINPVDHLPMVTGERPHRCRVETGRCRHLGGARDLRNALRAQGDVKIIVFHAGEGKV
jgi:hypothetical protein